MLALRRFFLQLGNWRTFAFCMGEFRILFGSLRLVVKKACCRIRSLATYTDPVQYLLHVGLMALENPQVCCAQASFGSGVARL